MRQGGTQKTCQLILDKNFKPQFILSWDVVASHKSDIPIKNAL